MNILVDELPSSVMIGGDEYRIRTDFRVWVLFEMLWQDDDMGESGKVRRSLELCYYEIPARYGEAVNALLWFYKCGREERAREREAAARRKRTRVYSFDYDADYIYAAFMTQYGIDLQDVDLHWWKFRAMFNALTSQNEFVKIMEYRGIDLTEDMPEGQKAFYRKMKTIHALPLPKGEEETQTAIEDALLNGGDLSGILGNGGG